MKKGKKIALWVVGCVIGFMTLSVLVATFVPDTTPPAKVSIKTRKTEKPKVETPKPKPKPLPAEETQVGGKRVTIKTVEPKPGEKPKNLYDDYVPPKPKSEVKDTGAFFDLAMTLEWDGYVFTLANKTNRVWTNVEFEINEPLLTRGYIMRVSRVGPTSKITLRARQFCKPDGTIFNPQTTRPVKFSVLCDVEGSNKKGFWLGQFN